MRLTRRCVVIRQQESRNERVDVLSKRACLYVLALGRDLVKRNTKMWRRRVLRLASWRQRAVLFLWEGALAS